MSEREQAIVAVMSVLMVNEEPPTGYRHTAEVILDRLDALASQPVVERQITEEDFAGDPDAESPFVIPSREGGAFPQGVGGARVDAAIAKQLAQSRREAGCPGPLYLDRAPSQETGELERLREVAREAATVIETLGEAILQYEVGQGHSAWDYLLAKRAWALVFLRDRLRSVLSPNQPEGESA